MSKVNGRHKKWAQTCRSSASGEVSTTQTRRAVIPRCAVWLALATSQIQAFRFTDLCYFVLIRSVTGFCMRILGDYDPRIVTTPNMQPLG